MDIADIEQAVEELIGEIEAVLTPAGCTKCGATDIPVVGHEPCPGPRTETDIANDPQPGDIYHTSWGYDQTNVEYFQVVKRNPRSVVLRSIAAEVRDNRLWPKPGKWVIDRLMENRQAETATEYTEKLCRFRAGDRPASCLKIDSSRWAFPYTGGGQHDTHAAGQPGH